MLNLRSMLARICLHAVCSLFSRSQAVHAECRDLVEKLLVKDVTKRLGSESGAEEIKAHPFFRGINWALLRHEPPPFVPRRGGAPASKPPADLDNY